MDLNLSGKRALVCGSTQGIGLAAAIEIAQLGASVTLMARNADRLGAAVASLPVIGQASHDTIAADFSDPAGVDAAVATHQDPSRPWHILINNTGGPPGGRGIDASIDEYVAAFNAHLVCNQMLAQRVVPGMRAARYGRIINIISTSVKQPIPGLGVSNTIRGAVASWAKTLAHELASDGITVNNVLPGFTMTQRLKSLIAKRAEAGSTTEDAVADTMQSSVPAGRFGEAHEVGSAVAFLASPAAGYINGVNLPVDGGRTGSL